MSRILRPQFKDMQVCKACGAPAEIIGEPWNRNGEADWFRAPLEIRCSPHVPGAQARERAVEGGGKRVKTATYYVRIYTHICTRNSYEDAQGNRSELSEHRYICGALQEGMTRKANVEELPDYCFEDGGREKAFDESLTERWSA
jgi:hypothetical protein